MAFLAEAQRVCYWMRTMPTATEQRSHSLCRRYCNVYDFVLSRVLLFASSDRDESPNRFLGLTATMRRPLNMILVLLTTFEGTGFWSCVLALFLRLRTKSSGVLSLWKRCTSSGLNLSGDWDPPALLFALF